MKWLGLRDFLDCVEQNQMTFPESHAVNVTPHIVPIPCRSLDKVSLCDCLEVPDAHPVGSPSGPSGSPQGRCSYSVPCLVLGLSHHS